MSKEFIPYEEAQALKELGFDEECFKWVIEKDKGDYIYYPLYDFPIDEKGGVPCPLYQQAFRWFREEHGLQITIHPNKWCEISRDGYVLKDTKTFDTEEAELACLRKLIEIVKQR